MPPALTAVGAAPSSATSEKLAPMIAPLSCALADIVERYGSGEIRNSHMQNILVPNIPDAHLEAVQAARGRS